MQACSILYKTKLPLLLAFNKIDVVRYEFAVDWMRDYEAFNEALQRDTTYAATLSRSLSLARRCFCSAIQNTPAGAQISCQGDCVWSCGLAPVTRP